MLFAQFKLLRCERLLWMLQYAMSDYTLQLLGSETFDQKYLDDFACMPATAHAVAGMSSLK